LTQITAGSFHSLGLTSTGQLYAFGDNYFGELGSPAHNFTSEPNPTPTMVDLPDVARIDTLTRGSEAGHTLVVADVSLLPPRITAARQSARRWRQGTKLAEISTSMRKNATPVGSTFSFTLTEDALVTFSFTQRVTGSKLGRKCVARTRGNRQRSTCKRTVVAGALVFDGHSGTNKVVFQGRVSRNKRLTAGPYRLAITALTALGGESTPVTLRFTIVK
jgi:hypothetical protein